MYIQHYFSVGSCCCVTSMEFMQNYSCRMIVLASGRCTVLVLGLLTASSSKGKINLLIFSTHKKFKNKNNDVYNDILSIDQTV